MIEHRSFLFTLGYLLSDIAFVSLLELAGLNLRGGACLGIAGFTLGYLLSDKAFLSLLELADLGPIAGHLAPIATATHLGFFAFAAFQLAHRLFDVPCLSLLKLRRGRFGTFTRLSGTSQLIDSHGDEAILSLL